MTSFPQGCIMTGENKVQGQCDARACTYPFCETLGSQRKHAQEAIRHAWDDLKEELERVRRA
jgi:hypothetical protein